MFGYRLVREADWTALQTQLAEKTDKIERLLRELIEARSSERSKATAADLMTTRLNVAELERAQLQHKVTGVPAVAPQITAGPPLRSEAMGASFDMFEDVGDAEAERLRGLKMLHDQEAMPDMPSGAELAAGATP